jgi:hypothetical protein
MHKGINVDGCTVAIRAVRSAFHIGGTTNDLVQQ